VTLKASRNATVLESMLGHRISLTTIHEKADEFLKVFGQVLKQARAIRRLGSAAIDICWVAADGWTASGKRA
jgi:fructose-1,6-bisphosphatase/inositol monophosphatase family enzyme